MERSSPVVLDIWFAMLPPLGSVAPRPAAGIMGKFEVKVVSFDRILCGSLRLGTDGCALGDADLGKPG